MTNKQMKSSCCGAEIKEMRIAHSSDRKRIGVVYNGCINCGKRYKPQEEKTNKEKILEEFESKLCCHDPECDSDSCPVGCSGITMDDVSKSLDSYAEYALNQFKAELREKIEGIRKPRITMLSGGRRMGQTYNLIFNHVVDEVISLLSPDQVDNS